MSDITFKSNQLTMVSIVVGLFLAAGPWPAWSHGKGIYDTQAEAEIRAQDIGCSTTHQNNGKWMPCADERELHRQLRKQ